MNKTDTIAEMKNKHKNYIFIFTFNKEKLGKDDCKIHQEDIKNTSPSCHCFKFVKAPG